MGDEKHGEATKKADQKNVQSAALKSERAKKNRPGFDLGGSERDTTAGTGLGLGRDASENAAARRLPGRRFGKWLSPAGSGSQSKLRSRELYAQSIIAGIGSIQHRSDATGVAGRWRPGRVGPRPTL